MERLELGLERDARSHLDLAGAGSTVETLIPEGTGIVQLGIIGTEKEVIEDVVSAELKLKIITLVNFQILEDAGIHFVPLVGPKRIATHAWERIALKVGDV